MRKVNLLVWVSAVAVAVISQWLQSIWYGDNKPPIYLRGIAWVYDVYLSRLPSIELTREPKPVIVVGNVVAGGSGKTPLVIYLAELAMRHGLRVAVIARIYKGSGDGPFQVTDNTPVSEVGDEPKLLQKRLTCPVVVSRKRSQSIDYIIKNDIECDIIISDDGLQHQALPRAVEIGIVDGQRGLGNGYLLPAGPLREPVERLKRCQWIISKGQTGQPDVLSMTITSGAAVNLITAEQCPVSVFVDQPVTAVAAIANPDSFFAYLHAQGINFEPRYYPDHYFYRSGELDTLARDRPLLMTEKDAVKCEHVQSDKLWYVPIQVELPEAFDQAFISRCQVLIDN